MVAGPRKLSPPSEDPKVSRPEIHETHGTHGISQEVRAQTRTNTSNSGEPGTQTFAVTRGHTSGGPPSCMKLHYSMEM